MGEKCKWPGGLLTILLALGACGTPLTAEPVDLPPPPSIETLEDFQRALTTAGVDWTVGESVSDSLFETLEASYLLEGESLIGYEFESVSQREEALSGWLDGDPQVPLSLQEGSTGVKVWSTGRLIVLFAGDSGGSRLVLNGLLGDPVNQDPAGQDEPYPPGISAVFLQIAEIRGINPSQILVLGYEQAEWRDACLELPAHGEDCPSQLTPGWRVRLQIFGEALWARADVFGDVIRLED